MTTDREYIVRAIEKVISGKPLNRYSFSTISEPNHCAQLVRETVEGGVGIRANEWEVAQLAHKYRQQRRSDDRFAIDYEAAAKELGLEKPFSQMRVGDVLYWPFKQWGHTALYAGLINGEPFVLENSGWNPLERQRQGAKLPLGSKAYVFLSPLRLLGTPRLTITPTKAIQAAERIPTPVAVPAVPIVVSKRRLLLSQFGGEFQDISDARVEIKGAASVVINATDPDKIQVRVQ